MNLFNIFRKKHPLRADNTIELKRTDKLVLDLDSVIDFKFRCIPEIRYDPNYAIYLEGNVTLVYYFGLDLEGREEIYVTKDGYNYLIEDPESLRLLGEFYREVCHKMSPSTLSSW